MSFYDWTHSFYDSLFHRMPVTSGVREELRNKVLRMAGKTARKKILVAGVGTGYELEGLEGKEIVALDVSPGMLGRIKRKDVVRVLADVHHIPFPDEYFDLVVCFQAFHHFEHPYTAMHEMRRVLKKKGRLILVTFRKLPFNSLTEFMITGATGMHVSHYSRGELNDLLQDFRKVQIEEYPDKFLTWLLDYEFLVVEAVK
jgi:ubiquinone/menaquinone biosynthesis C-methylase UbiE